MGTFHLGTLTLDSPAFGHGDRIPDRHTPNAENVSPELRWQGAPDGAAEYAVICHDPDAPLTRGYVHWVTYGIPGEATSLPEDSGTRFTAGVNEAGEGTYSGPAPPPGHGTHFYFFHLYALDEALDLEPGLTAAQLLDRIDDHILEQARVVGTYSTPAE